MNKLRAYHNDPSLKESLISQLQVHYEADEIIKGVYWENGKGCAIGCMAHMDADAHEFVSEKYGWPLQLCYLIDRLFEGLPNDRAKEFPLQVTSAIPVGADLSKVWNRFAIWLLIDEKYGAINFAKNISTKSVIQKIADLHVRSVTEEVTESAWIKGAAAAYAAAAAAADADDAAAAAGYAADAADDADDAAYAAAYAAGYAADAAGYAADAAAAAATARENHYIAQSDKLLELLREAKQ